MFVSEFQLFACDIDGDIADFWILLLWVEEVDGIADDLVAGSLLVVFGGVGVFAIPEMGRFYRHVLIEKNYPHHGAVAFGHFGKALFEVFKYIGVPVEDLNYNQPKSLPYPTENPWG